MGTNNRKIQVYLHPEVDKALEAFKQAKGFKSDSQAVNRILSLFFKLQTMEVEKPSETTRDYRETTRDLQSQIDLLNHKYCDVLKVLKKVTTSESLETTSESLEDVDEEVTTSESLETTSDYVESVVTTSESLETTSDYVESVVTTSESLETTSDYVEDVDEDDEDELPKEQPAAQLEVVDLTASRNKSIGNSKITEQQKEQILALYRETDHTTQTLAKLFKVTPSTISRLLKTQLQPKDYDLLIDSKRLKRGHEKNQPTLEEFEERMKL